jgi:NADH:ubiquinone reductase (non-electrogenic)
MEGSDGSIYAIGDCTATSYAPTAQVASQQGAYLARLFAQIAKKDALEVKAAEAATKEEAEDLKSQLAKVKLRPFHYSHQGSLAYIGSDKAIADLPFFNGNVSFQCLSLCGGNILLMSFF